MSVAVAIDGEIVHEAAMGVRVPETVERRRATDRFRIASISKMITAITVLQLVEEGLVGLDDPVGALVADDLGVAGIERRRSHHGPAAADAHLRARAVRERVLPQSGRLVSRRRPPSGSPGRCRAPEASGTAT